MLKKLILIIILLIPLLFTTSCWDMVDVEKRAFIVGIGIDKGDKADEIKVTFQIALPQAFAAQSGGDIATYWNVTLPATDITGARRLLLRHINSTPTYEHCKMLLFSDEIAKEGISSYLDFFIRDNDVRNRMEVAVVNGNAIDVLNKKFENNRIPSLFVVDILTKNSNKNFGITDYSFIGRMNEYLVLNSGFLLCRIIHANLKIEHLEASGAGIFNNDFKLVGWFSGEQLMAARFLRGDINIGLLDVDLPKELGKSISFNVFSTKTSLKPEFRNNKLFAVSRIRIEGDIQEISVAGFEINGKTMKAWEGEISKYLESLITNTFKDAQSKFKCEPFRFNLKVMDYYPNYWDENASNWEEIFQTVEIDVQVDAHIRRIGNVNY